jgi:hypothetical protein
METVHKVCLVFTVIGAINWGLIGFFDFNLVTALFQDNSTITTIVYSIVGICGLINSTLLFNHITSDPVKK